MSSTTDLLNSIQASGNGLTLAELLTQHPDIARRTAQRLIAKLIESGQVAARGVVIKHPELDPLSAIQRSVAERVPEQGQPDVQALIVEELRRRHEGVLARCGLRPSEYTGWKAVHGH